MKTLNRIFSNVMSNLPKISTPQKKFLKELFGVVFSIFGKGNFTNFARFSAYNECTFRRNFSKFFNWVQLNYELICMYNSRLDVLVSAIDCSFIPKSGGGTFGVDKFWSGVNKTALKGLEISVLAIINTRTSLTMTLDVTQTPPSLKSGEGKNNEYTRIDFYLEQFTDCLDQLKNVDYVIGDGYYAKQKVIENITSSGKHLITKLRCDANLRCLYNGKQKSKGAHRKYGCKVFYDNVDKWIFEGVDYNHHHLHIYYQTLNSPNFKRNLKVVLILNTRTNKYILLASTDVYQDARQILRYYQLRFQIEFLFRDAKQFACLNHCQARDEQKLDFHFNMSLAAINLARAAMIEGNIDSLNTFVRMSYNNRFAKNIFSKLSSKAEFDINNPPIEELITYGSMTA